MLKTFHPITRQILACSLTTLIGLSSATAQAAPQVNTSSGTLQGSTIDGVQQFLGIPYAAPPVGSLRWKAPQAPLSWQGVRDATRIGAACPQLPGDYSQVATSEDCLNLNVYVPEASESTPRPVIVWIHPGSLTMGSGSDFDGKSLARRTNAVIVTINYRLGVLGFLSTTELQQEALAGNYGIQDQQQALRWVQSNIQAFGGDRDRITLAGNSAGAASNCVHLASPASKGLFHRVIMQSGPCVRMGNKTLEQARTHGDTYASLVNCPVGTGQLACLRSRSAQELVAVAGDGLDALQSINPWNPVVDGAILPRKLTDMIRDGEINKVPVLVGTTSQEGRFFVSYAFHQKRGRAMTADDYVSAAEVMTGSAFAGSTSRALYTASNHGSYDLAMSALMTDSGFACPALTDARRLSRHTPVYTYEFTDGRAPAPADGFFELGAYHTAELQYLFGAPVFATQVKGSLDTNQRALADQMVNYWAAFAATGDPNHSSQPKWTKFNELTMPIMNLAPTEVGLQRWGAFVQSHRCLTWSLLFALSGQS